jgi:hypothetical protein
MADQRLTQWAGQAKPDASAMASALVNFIFGDGDIF